MSVFNGSPPLIFFLYNPFQSTWQAHNPGERKTKNKARWAIVSRDFHTFRRVTIDDTNVTRTPTHPIVLISPCVREFEHATVQAWHRTAVSKGTQPLFLTPLFFHWYFVFTRCLPCAEQALSTQHSSALLPFWPYRGFWPRCGPTPLWKAMYYYKCSVLDLSQAGKQKINVTNKPQLNRRCSMYILFHFFFHQPASYSAS